MDGDNNNNDNNNNNNSNTVLRPKPIPPLFQLSLSTVASHIKQFPSFSGIGDSFVLDNLLREVKKQNRLNNNSLKNFLISELETLEL